MGKFNTDVFLGDIESITVAVQVSNSNFDVIKRIPRAMRQKRFSSFSQVDKHTSELSGYFSGSDYATLVIDLNLTNNLTYSFDEEITSDGTADGSIKRRLKFSSERIPLYLESNGCSPEEVNASRAFFERVLSYP